MGRRAGRSARANPETARSEAAVERTFYRLADDPREVILVACRKCDWKAAFQRAELIAAWPYKI